MYCEIPRQTGIASPRDTAIYERRSDESHAMIRYSMTCDKGHSFDGWFQSAAGYESLHSAGLVNCARCGSAQVSKSLMAPAVVSDKAAPPALPLSAPASPAETALAELRRKVEENSEYVGMSFASEARAIHDGDAPERSIYGETRPDEAMRLIADGIPVAPLPFMPKRGTH